MPIGTSLGAYHEDDFAHVAAPWMDMGDKDKNVVTPNEAQQNKQMDQIENDQLGGIQIANTINTPVDSAATMAAGATEKAADALKQGRGTKPTSDVDTGLEGKVYYQGKYGSITDKDIEAGMDVGMAVAGGGMKTNVLEGVPRIGLKPANDNIPDLYNPRDPSMIGSKTLDDALDNSFKQMQEHHDTFIKKYDELHALGNKMADSASGFDEVNTARYNKLGREINPDWKDIKPEPPRRAAKGPETVGSAALVYKDTVYQGANHGIALGDILDKFGDVSMKDIKDGFVTSHGRFVSREQAFDLAKKQKQISPEIANEPSNTMLLSEDLQ